MVCLYRAALVPFREFRVPDVAFHFLIAVV
jgi:hypothetical protein